MMKRHDPSRIRASSFARVFCLRATITLAILCPAVAQATSFSWISTSGRFDTASSWTQSGSADLDGIPDSNDIVTFDRGNVTLYPVYFGNLLVPNSDIHPTVDRVVIGTNPLSFVGLYGSTLTVDSTNITETARGVVIGSGAGDVAALTSTLATFDTQYATLGSAAGSNGTLNLTSTSAGAFSVSGTSAVYDLIVGLSGTGAINVSNGRDVTVADDTVLGLNSSGAGNVTISGAGSTWTSSSDLTVGLSGSGTFTISSDADVVTNGANGLRIGDSGTGSGQVSISGNGSTWTNGAALHIGYGGNGTLAILSGGDFINNGSFGVTIGNQSSATGIVMVDGTGSTWTNPNTGIYVGILGDGSLDITNGGLVTSVTGTVGYSNGATGEATVSASQWTMPGILYVGGDGAIGTLEIRSGGHVANQAGYVGWKSGSTGTVTVAGTGSAWNNSSDLFLGDAGHGTANVTSGGQLSNAGANIGNGANSIGQITVDGAGSTWNNSSNLYVGNSGTGTMNITAGGHVTNVTGYIAGQNGGSGQATVDGTGSSWTNSGMLNVGYGGNGRLTITRQAQVSSGQGVIGSAVGSSGTVTVDGSGSRWTANLTVGLGGSGTVNISNGAVVTDGSGFIPEGASFIGYNSGSTGSVTVDGPDSNWRAGHLLEVGHQGQGSLNVTDRGSAGAMELKIGYLSGSNGSVSVDGMDSSLYVQGCSLICNASGSLDVGGAGTGMLSVTNGGRVTSDSGNIRSASGTVSISGASSWDNAKALSADGILNVTSGGNLVSGTGYIGRFGGTNGVVTINGIGSTWNNSAELYVGSHGNGMLDITNGGHVTSATSFISTNEYVNHGLGSVRVDGTGSRWTVTSLYVGGIGGEGGTLTVSNHGVVQVGVFLQVRAAAELRGDGEINGNVTSSGLVAPGVSIGSLRIQGDYGTSGAVQIELASASSYDQLLITGDVTVGGALAVNLVNGYTPSIGQSFTILTADLVNGTFAAELLPSVPNLEFDVIYNAQSVVLKVLSALPGDFNGNGVVDGADYVVWRKIDGTQTGYETWRAHFGQTAGSGSVANSNDAVPESATLVLLILAAAGRCFWRRRAV
jgi:T5SS/PEP-CTERM-associated repeat protein